MFDLNSENMNKNTNDFKSSAGLNLTKQNRKSGTRTEFLHIKKIMDVEIKNEKLKCLINECPRFGPYYSKCQTCNNKNLVFFKDMKYENAEKLLRYFKKSGNT